MSCKFCEKADFGNYKTYADNYGASIYVAGGSSRFPKEEQFKYCPECGVSLNGLSHYERSNHMINEIQERLSRITQGKWTNHEGIILSQDRKCLASANGANADFIAHAPEDIAFLLDEVKRFTAERDEYKLAYSRVCSDAYGYPDEGIDNTTDDENEQRKNALNKRMIELEAELQRFRELKAKNS